MAKRLEGTDKEHAMDTLSKLGLKYGTDKIGKHNYLPLYYAMFNNKKNKIKKVLEIGVGEGLGLRMFRDFFPNAMIYGAEIEDNRIFIEDRIKTIKCDQTEVKDLRRLLKIIGTDIDIVIDDGSHIPDDQVFTCVNMMPFLNKKTIYIIEDVSDPNILDQLNFYYESKMIKLGDRYDDRLIIVRK